MSDYFHELFSLNRRMAIADEFGNQRSTKSSSTTILKYPEELSTGLYPHIQFVCEDPDSATENKVAIHLPLPLGLVFNEGAKYTDVELGVAQPAITAVESGADAAAKQKSLFDSFTKGVSGAYDEMKRQLSDLNTAAKIQLAGAALGVNQEALSTKTKQIINPNTRTAFKGNEIRKFEFSFKLVAKSESETRTIRNIALAFRRGVYATSGDNEFALRYPAVWQIRFFSSGAEESKYIPQIDREGCYLTAATATFNTASNLWHADGSPVELDVKLSFAETRVLKRSDIDGLMLPVGAEKRGEKKTRKSLIASIKKAFKKTNK